MAAVLNENPPGGPSSGVGDDEKSFVRPGDAILWRRPARLGDPAFLRPPRAKRRPSVDHQVQEKCYGKCNGEHDGQAGESQRQAAQKGPPSAAPAHCSQQGKTSEDNAN